MPRGPLDRSRAHSLSLGRDPLCQSASTPLLTPPSGSGSGSQFPEPSLRPLPPSLGPALIVPTEGLFKAAAAAAALGNGSSFGGSPQLRSPLLPVRGAGFTGLNGGTPGGRWLGSHFPRLGSVRFG